MGVPGWPDLAACTASMERVRMVLMVRRSLGSSVLTARSCVPGMLAPLDRRTTGQRTSYEGQRTNPTTDYTDDTDKAEEESGVLSCCPVSFLIRVIRVIRGWLALA